jgi:hypothetical protein
MRRRQWVGELPSRLRTFHPRDWLLPGEDPTDPIVAHYRAWSRWMDACANVLNVDWPDVPDDGRLPPDCPCVMCERARSGAVQTDVLRERQQPPVSEGDGSRRRWPWLGDGPG